MSLKTFPTIPMETARAARAVFGRSNFYLVIGDQVNRLFNGLILEDPPGRVRKPARTQAMLYLITIFQYIETLPDFLAADALRQRLDWKYALHMLLNEPGLKAASFCEFRQWVLVDQGGKQNLQTLLSRLSEFTDFSNKRLSSLESSQVIAFVCQISRLAKIWEALNQALEAVATRQPEWLLAISLPHWYERYSDHRRNLNLRAACLEKQVFAQAIGIDGAYLLKAISDADLPELKDLPEVLTLENIWQEQYSQTEGKVFWRKEACVGCKMTAHL